MNSSLSKQVLHCFLFTSLALFLPLTANAQTGTFSATGSMTTARFQAVRTSLPNGKVLVAGGYDSSSRVLASAEHYTPTTWTFSATGSMAAARYGHTATLLRHGKVLVAGGFNPGGLAGAELYDPTAATFSATGSMTAARGN